MSRPSPILALLLLIASSVPARALAKMPAGEKTASVVFAGSYGANAPADAVKPPDFAGETTPPDYGPAPGRPKWLNRDLIGQKGGLNLYGMVGNKLASYMDAYGLALYLPPAPNPPDVTDVRWFSERQRKLNNCFNCATDRPYYFDFEEANTTPPIWQPSMPDGRPIPRNGRDCSTLVSATIASTGGEKPRGGKCKPCFHLIRVWNQKPKFTDLPQMQSIDGRTNRHYQDFHFYRCDSNGKWSENRRASYPDVVEDPKKIFRRL